MEVTFKIDKAEALKEVRRLTAYMGSRKQGDEGAYVRISATDSDADMLEQFWKAACSAVTEQFKHYAKSVEVSDEGYDVTMEMSELYDTNLNESIKSGLLGMIVHIIVSKWFKITSPEDEAKYAAEAAGYMADIERKIYHRKRPTR